ncbi:MAG: hypothetical protein IPG08_09615 [Sphingobacteriaceae bacterium]|nr:hypothetical protein [Sphingobacteriaceae bacterium]
MFIKYIHGWKYSCNWKWYLGSFRQRTIGEFSTSFSSAVSFTNQGVYSYVWVVGNGVCPTSTDVVTINTFLNPSDPDAGPDQTICAMNTTLNANAITVGTGSWIPVDVLSSVTNSLAKYNKCNFT